MLVSYVYASIAAKNPKIEKKFKKKITGQVVVVVPEKILQNSVTSFT
jgi:hypothetical protein